jgi:hypothetical protein
MESMNQKQENITEDVFVCANYWSKFLYKYFYSYKTDCHDITEIFL